MYKHTFVRAQRFLSQEKPAYSYYPLALSITYLLTFPLVNNLTSLRNCLRDDLHLLELFLIL